MATFAYVRVSTSEQASSGAGAQAQADAIRTYAAANGLDGLQTFEDLAVCREACPYDRPGFSALLEQAKPGDSVVVARWDRLGTLLEVSILLRDLAKRDIRVLSVNGDPGDSPESELFRNLQLAIATYELKLIRARTRAGLAAIRRRGGRDTRRRYGYRPEGDRFIPDEYEQAVCRRIVQDVSQGRTPHRIARELSEDGISSPEGRTRWNATTVRRVYERAVATSP
jgi:site-specific DNA recombinase